MKALDGVRRVEDLAHLWEKAKNRITYSQRRRQLLTTTK